MPLNFGSASPGASANFCCTKHKHFKIYGRHGPGMPARQRLQVCIRRKLGLELSGACAKLRFLLHSTLNLALLLRAELQVHSLKQLWCCRAAWELSGVQAGSCRTAWKLQCSLGFSLELPCSLACSLGAWNVAWELLPGSCRAAWELPCSLRAVMRPGSCRAAWELSCGLPCRLIAVRQTGSCRTACYRAAWELPRCMGAISLGTVAQCGSCRAAREPAWNCVAAGVQPWSCRAVCELSRSLGAVVKPGAARCRRQ